MIRFTLRWSLVLAALGAFVLAGCSSSKTKIEESETSSQVTPEKGAAAAAIAPASTVEGILAQIDAERGKLSSTIQSGQLGDVHHLAFGIRDLVIALADKANAVSPAGTTQLNGMVDLVKVSATQLDELGDAGNLGGTQAEFAKFEAALDSIKSAVGGN